ncbi:bile acid:sodium symporter, partial [Escherichia coli]
GLNLLAEFQPHLLKLDMALTRGIDQDPVRQAIVAGAGHWRLHLLVFSLTFVLFPLLGLALKPLLSPMIGKDLYMGMLYLCALPATVQSAIAFT